MRFADQEKAEKEVEFLEKAVKRFKRDLRTEVAHSALHALLIRHGVDYPCVKHAFEVAETFVNEVEKEPK